MDVLARRKFLMGSGLLLAANWNALWANKVDFSSLKVGYLPITDHLLVISKSIHSTNFSPIKFGSWPDLSEALRAKSIDGAFILTPLALQLKSQGVNLKAIMAAHRNGSALILRKDLIGKERQISDLKGKKIAIPSRFSTHYLLLSLLLEKAGLKISDVLVVDMSPPEMLSALLARSIDGYIVAEPFGIAAQKSGVGEVFILSKDIINNHICCVVVFRQEVIDKHRGEIESLVQSFVQTSAFIQNNHQQAAKLSKQFLGQKPELIDRLLLDSNRVIFEHLALTKEDIAMTLQAMKEYQLGDLPLSYESFVDKSFISSQGQA